jgi:hypothetical protein
MPDQSNRFVAVDAFARSTRRAIAPIASCTVIAAPDGAAVLSTRRSRRRREGDLMIWIEPRMASNVLPVIRSPWLLRYCVPVLNTVLSSKVCSEDASARLDGGQVL